MNDETMLDQLEALFDVLNAQIVRLESSMESMRDDVSALEQRLNNLRNEG